MRGDEEERMVLQIAPDASKACHDLDAQRAQFRRRPYSGAQQERGRMNGASRKNDLSPTILLLLAVDVY